MLEPVLNELGAGREPLEGPHLRLSFLEVGARAKVLLPPSRLRQVPRQLHTGRQVQAFILLICCSYVHLNLNRIISRKINCFVGCTVI